MSNLNTQHAFLRPAADGPKRCVSAQHVTAQSVPWHTGSRSSIKKSGGTQGVGPASRVGSTVPGSRSGMEGAGFQFVAFTPFVTARVSSLCRAGKSTGGSRCRHDLSRSRRPCAPDRRLRRRSTGRAGCGTTPCPARYTFAMSFPLPAIPEAVADLVSPFPDLRGCENTRPHRSICRVAGAEPTELQPS